jgi:hypothetical protein
MYCLFRVLLCIVYCPCILYYCHRVATQLQLTNISYHIITEMEAINYINNPFVMTGSCQWFVSRTKPLEAVAPICVCWLYYIDSKAMFPAESDVQRVS